MKTTTVQQLSAARVVLNAAAARGEHTEPLWDALTKVSESMIVHAEEQLTELAKGEIGESSSVERSLPRHAVAIPESTSSGWKWRRSAPQKPGTP